MGEERTAMKIVILGAGALGSLLGAHLAQGGAEVILLARGPRAQWIREHGLTVTGLVHYTAPVHVVVHPQKVQDADVLLVAVKTYDTEAALHSLRHLTVESVLSVQNGVMKNAQVAHYFGWDKTLGAVAAFAGEVMPDGTVHCTIHDRFFLGALPEGTSARVQAVATAFAQAGLPTEVSPHIQSVEWSKYVRFVGLMAVAALTRLETYKFSQDPDLAHVRVLVEREVAQVAARLGIPLGDYGVWQSKTMASLSLEEAVVRIRHSGEQMERRGDTAQKVSALQDLERGRRLEVEEILGYAVRKGAELGLELPTVTTCYRLLAGIDRSLQ
jgi:2-dehydropantoate 2-reductase